MYILLICFIVPAVPTEYDVLIVCRQHNDKEWKFKEQHAKMWENIAGAKRYSRPLGYSPSWFQHCGCERPRRSDASAPRMLQLLGKNLVLDHQRKLYIIKVRWQAKKGR